MIHDTLHGPGLNDSFAWAGAGRLNGCLAGDAPCVLTSCTSPAVNGPSAALPDTISKALSVDEVLQRECSPGVNFTPEAGPLRSGLKLVPLVQHDDVIHTSEVWYCMFSHMGPIAQ
jgi:hypothetical protein